MSSARTRLFSGAEDIEKSLQIDIFLKEMRQVSGVCAMRVYLPRADIYSFLIIAYSKTNRKGQCQVSSVIFCKKINRRLSVVLAERMSCAWEKYMRIQPIHF